MGIPDEVVPMNRTRFSHGSGALTARDLNRLRDTSRVVEQLGPALPQAVRMTETPGKILPYFWANITGHSTWGSYRYRWTYSFEEMRWEIASDGPVSITAGIIGTDNLYNMNEAFNDNAATVLAPGYTVANIPAGFSYQPISTGTMALVFPHVTETGEQIFVFDKPNTIDGSCI